MRCIFFIFLFFCGYVAWGQYEPECRGERVAHSYYTLCFSEKHCQPRWVYYLLAPGRLTGTAVRKNNFREDKKVKNGSALPADYSRSGYDRGHLCPAADMSFSEQAMEETFYMSNMSPQYPSFNRGIWKKLEEKVRKWARNDTIYVATGPLFKEVKGAIGKNRITVPGYFYKVIYSSAKGQMIAFILPNRQGEKQLPDYVVTVDEVEAWSGIDFFPQLPDTLQNRLEAFSGYFLWETEADVSAHIGYQE